MKRSSTRLRLDITQTAATNASDAAYQRHCSRSRRTAFTLLELLIAVGLTSILMVALFSAMKIYFDLQLDSHEEITRQQVARSLLRQMARDIQSVVFVKKSALEEEDGMSTSKSGSTSTSSTDTSGGDTSGGTGTGSTGGTSTGSSTSTATSTTTPDGNSYGQSSIDPETVMTTYTNGLVGSATDLQLFVSRPDKNLAYVIAQDLSSTDQRTSDLLIVRYLLADTSAGGLASAVAERESQGLETGPVGLVKMQGDLFGLSTAVASDEEMPQVAAANLLAREVSSVQFRYFDGINWQEKWDSTALNELPKAIEIVLTLRDQASGGDVFSDEEVDQYSLPETMHRMVVPLPVAEPFIAESAI